MHYILSTMTAEEELIYFQFLGNNGFSISDFNLQKQNIINIKMS